MSEILPPLGPGPCGMLRATISEPVPEQGLRIGRQFTSPVMKPFLDKDFSFMPVETGCIKKIKTQATFFFLNYLLEIAIAGFITICILQI